MPPKLVQGPVGFRAVSQHRGRNEIRIVIAAAACHGNNVIERGKKLPPHDVSGVHLPIRMRRKLVRQDARKDTQSARKNEMRSQIAVDEAVTDKQACGRGLGVFSRNRLDRCKRVMLASDLRSDDALSGQQSVTNAADRLRLGLHGRILRSNEI